MNLDLLILSGTNEFSSCTNNLLKVKKMNNYFVKLNQVVTMDLRLLASHKNTE
jgi:hypothetical protein